MCLIVMFLDPPVPSLPAGWRESRVPIAVKTTRPGTPSMNTSIPAEAAVLHSLQEVAVEPLLVTLGGSLYLPFSLPCPTSRVGISMESTGGPTA